MPTSVIENRVVEMEFDNKRFEANVKETMTSLEKLKAALSFKGVKTGFEDIERDAKKFNLAPVEKSIETVKGSFNALELVAVGALMKIGSQAVSVGEKLIKGLSVDQLTAGWDKYGEKTQAVQRIVNATGLSIDEVNEQLDKLAWYTDETSFSFLDMVNNIGKFTANAVDLDTAVTAMQGISNWAGISGASVAEAGRAMYNLSQAIAVGSVKLMDWKSIENANMATAEFKQTVIDTAVELGTLQKASDGTLKTLQGHVVSAKNFNSALSDSWFTSEVLLKSLDKYGDFTNKLYEATETLDMEATDVLSAISAFKDGTLDLTEYIDEEKISAEEALKVISDLADESNNFGRKAFKASQEAKTFTEALEATKDAVSTGWMKTYELIFGNYKEAVKLWTAVANILWEIFASGGDNRNEVLGFWKELGRPALLDAVANGFMAVHNALKPIKEAFKEIFFPFEDNKSVAEWLVSLTEKFRDFTAGLGLSEGAAKDIKDAFMGIFTIIKQIGEGFVELIRNGRPLFKLIGSLGRLVIAVAGAFGRFAQAQNLVAKGFSLLTKVLKAGLTVIGLAVAGIVMLVAKIVELVSYLNQLGVFKVITTPLQILAAGIIYLYESIRKLLSLSIKTVPEFVKGIDNAIQGLIKRLRQFPVIDKALTIISNFFKAVGAGLYTIGQFMMPVLNFFRELGGLIAEGKWGEAFTLVADKLKEIKDTVKELIVDGIFGGFKDKDGNVVDADSKLQNFNETLKEFRENISVGKIVAIGFSVVMLTLAASITKLSNTASTTLTTFSGMFTNFNKIMRSLAARTAPVRQFAEAIAIIAASMALLSKMDENKLKSAFLYLVAITAIVGTFSAIIAKISRGKYKEDFRDFSDNLKMVSLLMIGLSISVAALSGALVILQRLTIDKDIWARLGILTLLMVELAAIGTVMAKFAPKLSAGGLILLLYSLGVKKIVEALVELGSIPLDGLQDKVVSLVSLMSGLGLLAMGMGNIRISSVLGVLLLAATFKKITPVFREEIIPAVNELSDSFVEFVEKLTVMLNNLIGANNTTKVLGVTMSAMSVTIITVTAIFASVTAVIAILGKAMKNVGKGIGYASIGLSIFLLSIGGLLAILKKNNIDMDMVDHIKELVLQILGLMEVMLLTASIFSGSKFGDKISLGGGDSPMVQFAKMMKAMSFFFISLMAFISVMTVVASGQNAAAFALAASLVESVLVMFALIITAAIFVNEHGAEALKNLKAIAVAMNLVMLLVVVLSAIPEEDLAHGLAAAVLVIGLLTACFAIINITSHSIKREDIKKSTINAALTVAIFTSIGLAIGGLIALALLMDDAGGPMNVLASAAAISMVLLSVKSIISSTLKLKVSKDSHPERILLGAAAIIAATMLPIAAIVNVVNGNKVNLASVVISAVALIGILFVLAHLIEVLQESFSSFTATKGRIQMLLALAGLILAIEVPLIAIVWVAKDADTVYAAMFSTVALLLALTGLLAALSKVGEMSKKGSMLTAAGSFALISTSLLIIAGAFKMLSNYDWEKNESAIGNLLACVVVMGVALGILTAIAAGSGGIGAVAIIAVAAAFLILGYAIKTAGEGIWVGASGMEKLIPILKELKDLGLSSIGKALDYLPGPLKAIGSAGKELKKGSDGLERGLTTIATACASLKDVDINYIFGELAEGTARFAESAPGLKDLNKVLPEFAQNIVRVANALDNVELAAIDAAFGLSKGTEEAIAMGIPYDAGFRLGDNYLEGFKAATGWNSPWKTTEEAGSFAPIGLYNGTMANIGMASTAGGLLGSNFITATCTAMGIYGAGTGAARSTRAEEAATATADSIVETSDSKLEDTKASGERQGDSWFTGFFNKIQEWAAKAPDLFGGIFNIFGISTDKAISGLENFASKGSKAGDTVTEIINAFKEGGFQGGLALLTEKIDGLTESIGGAGGLLEKLLGVEGISDEFDLILGEDSDMAKQMSDAIEAATAGLDEYSASAATAKNFTEELTDTIRNQMDIMSEFNSKTEITGEQMLNNMASQISGVRQWSENLQYLEQRGIDDGLLRYLTELGPAGYEKVAAFVNMTDEQLAMAGKLFTESLTIPESTAGEVSKSWWSTGEEAAKDFSEGLKTSEDPAAAGEETADKAVKAAREKVKEMKNVGMETTKHYINSVSKTTDSVRKAWKKIGEDSANALEDSTIKGDNDSGTSVVNVTEEVVEEETRTYEEALKQRSDRLKKTNSSILRAIWEFGMAGLPGHPWPWERGKTDAEQYMSGVITTLGYFTDQAGRQYTYHDSFWSSLDAIVSTQSPTYHPTIRPVLDTTSFTTDYTKFASAVSADYSKNLSGSINTRTSFDTAFLDAIEDLGDNSDVVEEVRSLKGAMADMTSQISKMQVVLDSNTLVGEMVVPLDNALGNRAVRSRRER